MSTNRALSLLGAALLTASAASAGEAKPARALAWSTASADASRLIEELRTRIDNFQVGPANVELARRIVAADPQFAMGAYYLSAVTPPPANETHLARAVELAAKASDGERRFIEAMAKVRANNGANFRDGIAPLERLVADYPGERLFPQILGQIYQAANQPDKARAAFEQAQAAHASSRVRAFLANDDLLKGRYAEARAAFEAVERDLPRGAAPFTVRYGIAFSHLYEGQVDAALASLHTYLGEYHASAADRTFPEVFIWNSIARINLENGRLNEALQAYEKGYESVPGSTLPDDQKKIWLGRLEHGKCRVLARMGRHEQAWQGAETVRRMIEEGGEEGQQFLPAYHYLVGYLKLESGDARAALEHLKQADPDNPFHELLLARAYERLGDTANARNAYAAVVASGTNGLERALAYPEAKRKLATL